MIGDETGQHGIDILIEFVSFTLNIAFINIYQYIIYHKNINAKSFTHSFFKHYPEVRSQYFGFVMGLTEVNVNGNTQWRKIKLMSLVSQRGDRTKKIEWKPKIFINLTLIPGVALNCYHQSCPDYIS